MRGSKSEACFPMFFTYEASVAFVFMLHFYCSSCFSLQQSRSLVRGTYNSKENVWCLHFFFSKSCSYNKPEQLTWVWTTTYHLMHVYTGLCLTAPYELIDRSVTGGRVCEWPIVKYRFQFHLQPLNDLFCADPGQRHKTFLVLYYCQKD